MLRSARSPGPIYTSIAPTKGGFVRLCRVILVAILLLTCGSVALHAASIEYASFGTFANSGAGYSITNASSPGGSSIIHGGGQHGSSITFAGISDLVDTPSVSPMGFFMTTTPLTSGEIDAYDGTTFTLIINQIGLDNPSGAVASKLSGTLSKSVKGAGASSLFLDWHSASLTLEGVTYAPQNVSIAGGTFTTITTLQGEVTGSTAPAPATAAAGGTLLALVAVMKLLRRPSSAPLAAVIPGKARVM